MMLYDVRDVRKLAREKATFFGKPRPAEVFVNALWWLRRADPEGDEKPVTIEYLQPAPAVSTDPEDIIWTGELFNDNLQVDDACMMYLVSSSFLFGCRSSHEDGCSLFQLERDQIEDLLETTSWLSPVTLARRALELHGGFHAHNNM